MEITLCESELLSRWARVTVDQPDAPSARRATTALRSVVYQTAYW